MWNLWAMEDDGAKTHHQVYTEHFHLVVVVLLSQLSIKHQQEPPYLPAEEVKLIQKEKGVTTKFIFEE